MIIITADTRKARVTQKELLTSGSAGIPVQYILSEDWDDLTRVAVFRNDEDSENTQIDIALTDTLETTVPWEILQHPDTIGTTVYAGIYGTDGNGTIVIPTIWVSLGEVKEGAVRGNASGSDPTPDMWAQIQAIAEEAGADNALVSEGYAVGTQDGTPVTSESTYYHNNAKYYSEQADASATAADTAESGAEAQALKSEGYAVGTQNGTPVTSGSPYYENNAEYMKDAAALYALQSDSYAGESAAWATGSYSGNPSGIPVSSDKPQYHNNAYYYAGQASGSATTANNAKTAAQNAQTAAEAAQLAAETAQGKAEDAQEAIEDMTVSSITLDAGEDATVTKTEVGGVVNLEFGIPKGSKGDPGTPGATGNGIASIAKTGTSGKVDTYTITYTSGSTTTFTVTNGNDGEDGDDGITPTVTATAITGGHNVAFSYGAGDPRNTDFDVMDGANTDADDVTYDPTETYTAGSVGAGLNQLNSDITDLANNKAPIITDTASGAIASFPDGADGLPVKQLTVAVNPVQDLHGYDSPWPAGGGKNKADPNKITLQSISAQGAYVDQPNGEYRALTIDSLGAGTYTLSTNLSDAYVVRFRYEVNGTVQVNGNITHTPPLTVTFEQDVTNVGFSIRKSDTSVITEAFWVQVESGSTATSYAPYSNECPISGWTGANIYDSGKNLLDPTKFSADEVTVSDGVYTFSRSGYAANLFTGQTGTGHVIPLEDIPKLPYLQAGTYVWSYKYISGGTFGSAYAVDSNGTRTSLSPTKIEETAYLSYRFTLTEPSRICIVRASNTNPSVFSEPQIEIGTVRTDYVPYQGTLLNVSFPDGAGTVYGCELTINENGSGALAVDGVKKVFDGTESLTGRGTSHPYVTYKVGDYQSIVDEKGICSHLPHGNITTTNEAVGFRPYNSSAYNGAFIFFRFDDSVVPRTTADYKTYFAQQYANGTPVEVVYYLTEPITYNLTVAQMQTLLGTNNVWADTGDVSLEYRADTKLYLEKLTAPTEDDLIADHAIASGTFFMIGNQLFKATAAIANGAAITIGTNATQLSLADALNQLNS